MHSILFFFLYMPPKYADVRKRYLSDLLSTHNVHELLFGIENAPVNENELLFKSTRPYNQIETAHKTACYKHVPASSKIIYYNDTCCVALTGIGQDSFFFLLHSLFSK